MQKIAILLLFSAVSLTASFAQKLKQFDYTIEPIIDGNQSHFIITIDFKQKEQGGMRFMLPQVWGLEGKNEFIELVSVKNATHIQSDSAITIKYKKNARIQITYRLKNAVEDTIPGRGQDYVPTIKSTYFSLFTNSAFILPEDNSGNKYNFTIRWKSYPEQYASKPITSFGNGLVQKLNYSTVEDFQNGILVGGDYRLYEQVNDKKQITRFAIRGKWAFKDSEMGSLIESTLHQQFKFWDDYSTKSFLITVSAGGYENEFEQSYTGTGLHNSFAVTAVCNNTTQVNELHYLFHHELMHHWIGNQIKNGVDEELSYWFSEGFTDYFSRKNMYEAGLKTYEQYTTLLDSVIAIHYTSPVATAHNDSIKAHFWERSYYGKLPYNRGSIFAYYLDGKLQKVSNGQYDLKYVMRLMLSETKLEKRPFDWQWLQNEILNLTNYDISSDYKKYILNGELIPIEILNENLSNALELRSTKVSASGFSTEKDPSSEKTFVTKIEKNTGIENSGLLVGDEVNGYSIYGNVSQECEVYVVRDGKEITIPFYGYKMSEPVPQHIKK